ncbi:MAG TPA: endonuclease/exonuclease/phosphatase family protein [Bacillota bacterium]|nr:endonuclease/exonuclease/phosphatase family protein [Bacillota bacterium]
MSYRELTVATVNIAGGMRAGDAKSDKFKLIAETLREYNPDIISLQEVIRVPEAGRDDLKGLRDEMKGEWYSFFFPHLDSHNHSHPQKWTSPIFIDYYSKDQRIYQGTGVLVRNKKNSKDSSSILALNLWDDRKTGEHEVAGVTIPYPPTIFCGGRDTEQRTLMMIRVQIYGINTLFCCTHLSSLKEEDSLAPHGEIQEKDGTKKIRKPTPASIQLREKQTKWIIGYIKSYQKELGRSEPLILAGDFNCEPDAKELKALRELGLVHGHLGNTGDWKNEKGWTEAPAAPYTHRNRFHSKEARRILIDHIFFTQAHFSIKEAYVIDFDQKGIPIKEVSDHNPVIVRLSVKG